MSSRNVTEEVSKYSLRDHHLPEGTAELRKAIILGDGLLGAAKICRGRRLFGRVWGHTSIDSHTENAANSGGAHTWAGRVSMGTSSVGRKCPCTWPQLLHVQPNARGPHCHPPCGLCGPGPQGKEEDLTRAQG